MQTEYNDLLDRLRVIVGVDHVITGDATAQFERDMQPLADAGRPVAVVRPASTDEVAAVVAVCARHKVPIIPRGAGSGMTGAANALAGAVTLVLTRMNQITIDEEAGLAIVQPGAVTLDIKKAALEKGFFYAPDPTSSDWCTIGGNVSNGSGGPCGSKYGVTRDAVRSLEVVLATGEVLRTGRRTLKGNTGYDLTNLFVGSEGTLAVITEVTLALRWAPRRARTAVAAFDNVEAAVATVSQTLASGAAPSLFEIMDGTCLGAVERHLGSALLDDSPTPAAVLFLQSDAETAWELDLFEAAAEAHEALLTYQTSDREEGAALMGYWNGLEEALEAMGVWVLHEVTVPRRRVGELITAAARIGTANDLFVGVHGHAADGTVHPMIVYRRDDRGGRARAHNAYDRLLDVSTGLGGTVTGEHGIGRMKTEYLANEVGDVGIRVHQAVKAALDPDGLFNPGSMFALQTKEP